MSRSYERLSLIVTTNLPFGESWVDIFGCERLTGALLDRLTHRVHILEVNGPSYRLMESKKKRKHHRQLSDSTSDPMDEDLPRDSGELETAGKLKK
jgi:hypothetical protein